MKPKFFRMAKKEALQSTCKFRVGAIVVSGNTILSMGHNDMKKSHPLMNEPILRLHAEVAALRSVKRLDCSDFFLYVYRVKKDGTQGLARPCGTCIEVLKKTNLKCAYFSLDGTGYGKLSLTDINLMNKESGNENGL